MSARIIGGLTFDLDDGPVSAKCVASSIDGRPTAWLVLGDGSDKVEIRLTDTPDETLAQLEAAVTKIRTELARQKRLAALPEVA